MATQDVENASNGVWAISADRAIEPAASRCLSRTSTARPWSALASKIARVFGYAWAAPNSAAGMLIGVAALALGARARLISGNVEICGGLLGRAAAGLPGERHFAAITLGHVILAVSPEALVPLRRHEHVHVRQYERWGVLFIPAYLLSSLWQVLRGRSAYSANHFERQVQSRLEVRPARVAGSI
jgi:hypothetical protein